MKEKKPKKRFLTANQIRDEIDAYKAKAIRLQQTAEALELASRELMKVPEMVEDAKFKMSQASKAHRASARIREVRLVKLKQKLSEFETQLLPGVIGDNDRSIQA